MLVVPAIGLLVAGEDAGAVITGLSIFFMAGFDLVQLQAVYNAVTSAPAC